MNFVVSTRRFYGATIGKAHAKKSSRERFAPRTTSTRTLFVWPRRLRKPGPARISSSLWREPRVRGS